MSKRKRAKYEARLKEALAQLAPQQPMAQGMTGTSRLALSARFAGWRPQSLDADGDASFDLADTRAFSRDLVRTAPVATGAIQTRASHIIGTGLSLQSRIDAEELGLDDDEAKEWQTRTERRFSMWASSVYSDVTAEQNYYEQQDLMLRAHDTSGDVFVLLADKQRAGWPFRLALQIIEADRACNPDGRANTATMVDGVEKTEQGEPLRLHLLNQHPGRIFPDKKREWTSYQFRSNTGRRNVLHLKKMERPGQTRGLPRLAPIIATIKQLTRYSDAEVDAAVNSAAMALFATMDANAFQDVLSDDERAQMIAAASGWDGNLDSGKIVNLMPGESIISPTPGRPNPNFDPFFGAMLNLVSMGLGMPKDVLAKAFNASYSASRAALMDAWRTWKIERAWFNRRINQPVYEEWLADAVALGIIVAPGFFSDPFIRNAWCGSNWSGDGPGALDPFKEAQAAELRINTGITTRAEEVVAYDGGDWEQKHRQSVRETADRVEGGLQAPVGMEQPSPRLPADQQDPEDPEDLEDLDDPEDLIDSLT